MLRKKPIEYDDLIEMYVSNQTTCPTKCPTKMTRRHDAARMRWYLECAKCNWRAEFEIVFSDFAPTLLARRIIAQRALLHSLVASPSDALRKEYETNKADITRLAAIVEKGAAAAEQQTSEFDQAKEYYELFGARTVDAKAYHKKRAEYAAQAEKMQDAKDKQAAAYYVRQKTPYYKISTDGVAIKKITGGPKVKNIKRIS